MSKNTKPYLSIIAASRNDNHGEDMLKRMRMFINGLIEQCNKYQLRTELIIVEWNPPAETEPLHQVLPKPKTADFLTLKYIVVPPELHYRYRFSKQIPLYQMIAKNVGIRRAEGEFVLCTNVDLLFSDKLFEFLSAQKLDKNSYYRANRCDVPASIKEEWTLKQQFEFCENNKLRVLGKNPLYSNMIDWPKWAFEKKFIALTLNYLVGFKYTFYDPVAVTFIKLDSNACGDFTLMHKDTWTKIEGYPELDLYSIHIDTLGIAAAAALGYKQVSLPSEACTYHIDHYNGWEALAPLERMHFVHNKPSIGFDVVADASKYIMKHKTTLGFNKPNWGFADVELQQITFNSPE
ncbi:MAG: hypothetical protein JST49_13900 [Bacteroidetes bacterium]|nr:hypothetical protein [Bacteroidota bacterium]